MTAAPANSGDRSRTFGSIAGLYERYRLDYPGSVADEVLAYAGRPVATAIEIGAGTGKATRLFTARGVRVLATDPDAGMLAELRRRVPDARTLETTLESLPRLEPVDLVLAAAALHWTRSEGRWSRVAALLVANGVVASMAIEMALADPELSAAVHDLGGGLAGVAPPPSAAPPGPAPMQWPGDELSADPRFRDVRQSVVERRVALSAADYVGLLSTMSSVNVLPPAERATTLTRVRARLPDVVDLRADVVLHLARRI